MKKKIAVALAVLVVALAALVGAIRWGENQQRMDAAREKLYLSWDAYISFRNEMDAIELWTLEHVERYSQERTWQSLLKARAALAVGYTAMRQLQTPDSYIERAVINALPNEEVITVAESLSGTPGELESACMAFANLQYELEDAFLYELDNERLAEAVSFYRQELEIGERNNARITNHLLLTWSMKDRWEEIAQQYPAFAAFMGEWEKKDAVLRSLSESAQDTLEKLYQVYRNSQLYSETALETVRNAVENERLAELAAKIVLPADLPRTADGSLALFPSPAWLQEPRNVYYAVHDADRGVQAIRLGDELNEEPTAVYYYYDYVTREEYEQYFEQLQLLGFPGLLKDNEDGSSMMMVLQDEYLLAVQWTASETILTLSNPMGCLVSPLDYTLLTRWYDEISK